MKRHNVLIISAQEFNQKSVYFDGLRLRTLGLAEGLVRNGVDVVVAFYSESRNDFTSNGVRFFSWRTIDNFADLVSAFNTVIFNYASLGLNEILPRYLKPDQILICDALVPIELENENSPSEHNNYSGCKAILDRADLFLVSSKNAIDYFHSLYKSWKLSNSKLVNERCYLVCPFGVDPKHLIKDRDYLLADAIKYIWYGGVYPWFDVDLLEEFIENFDDHSGMASLHLVGIDSPFFQNNGQRDTIEKLMNKVHKKKSVKVIPWLPINLRLEFLSGFDAAVFFNKVNSRETRYSWRTRYTDFLLSRTPLLVNEIDPFASKLIEYNCAKIVTSFDHGYILETINEIGNKGLWKNLADELSWENVTKEISKLLKEL